jgi:hypothetical protein
MNRRGHRQRRVGACSVLAGLVLVLPACRKSEPATPSPNPAPAPTVAPPAAAAAADPSRLVGRWRRSDSDYTIQVERAAPDGSIEVKYFNPQPIHVSRAAWKADAGRLLLFVELTDRGYPGNNYALLYDPGSDSLGGEYRHLGLNETYEVAFSRLDARPAP